MKGMTGAKTAYYSNPKGHVSATIPSVQTTPIINVNPWGKWSKPSYPQMAKVGTKMSIGGYDGGSQQ